MQKTEDGALGIDWYFWGLQCATKTGARERWGADAGNEGLSIGEECGGADLHSRSSILHQYRLLNWCDEVLVAASILPLLDGMGPRLGER